MIRPQWSEVLPKEPAKNPSRNSANNPNRNEIEDKINSRCCQKVWVVAHPEGIRSKHFGVIFQNRYRETPMSPGMLDSHNRLGTHRAVQCGNSRFLARHRPSVNYFLSINYSLTSESAESDTVVKPLSLGTTCLELGKQDRWNSPQARRVVSINRKGNDHPKLI